MKPITGYVPVNSGGNHLVHLFSENLLRAMEAACTASRMNWEKLEAKGWSIQKVRIVPVKKQKQKGRK